MKREQRANFDSVAAFYDRMARLVFGNTLLQAQLHYLGRIPGNGNVLILGGGSGELLEQLLRIKPTGRVCYIDSSASMISLSRARVDSNVQIDFIHGTEDSIPTDQQFDVIITNFYLDLFNDASLHRVIAKCKQHLKSSGLWLASDFVKPKRLADRILLKAMYLFFRVTTSIEAEDLPHWSEALGKEFSERESTYFRKGFVKSSIFQH